MYETLMRPHQVDSAPAAPTVREIGAQLKKAEARREQKRLRQIVQAQRQAKRKRGEPVDDDVGEGEGSETIVDTSDEGTVVPDQGTTFAG